MPWPSIEEVKAQRTNFFLNKNKLPRGRSSVKMTRSENLRVN